SNGQLTQIDPRGGLADAINNSGQVVGGAFTGINDSGQIAGSAVGPMGPGGQVLFWSYAVNNAGEYAGGINGPLPGIAGATGANPAIYVNGQTTDLFTKFSPATGSVGSAIAINQNGDVLIHTGDGTGGLVSSYLYHTNSGTVTSLDSVPGIT